MEIVYRRLIAEDAAQYRAIRLESIKAHPESFGSGYETQSKLPKLMFEEALERPYDDRFLIGAFAGEELIGICGFIPFDSNNKDMTHTGEIIQVYVRPAYSGRKVGLSLVSKVVDEAFELRDIGQIVLGVKEDNISANRVYEQAGFVTAVETGNKGYRRMTLRREAGARLKNQ